MYIATDGVRYSFLLLNCLINVGEELGDLSESLWRQCARHIREETQIKARSEDGIEPIEREPAVDSGLLIIIYDWFRVEACWNLKFRGVNITSEDPNIGQLFFASYALIVCVYMCV